MTGRDPYRLSMNVTCVDTRENDLNQITKIFSEDYVDSKSCFSLIFFGVTLGHLLFFGNHLNF